MRVIVDLHNTVHVLENAIYSVGRANASSTIDIRAHTGGSTAFIEPVTFARCAFILILHCGISH